MDFLIALRICWRARYQHSSLNCAWSEATVAGALGIRLGGPNIYFGQRIEKPWTGDELREIETSDISRAIDLMMLASVLALPFRIAGIFCEILTGTGAIVLSRLIFLKKIALFLC